MNLKNSKNWNWLKLVGVDCNYPSQDFAKNHFDWNYLVLFDTFFVRFLFENVWKNLVVFRCICSVILNWWPNASNAARAMRTMKYGNGEIFHNWRHRRVRTMTTLPWSKISPRFNFRTEQSKSANWRNYGNFTCCKASTY